MAEKATVIVDFIANYTVQKGCPPTNREIGKAVGWSSSSTISRHLQRLREAGVIDWIDGCPRTIRVVK